MVEAGRLYILGKGPGRWAREGITEIWGKLFDTETNSSKSWRDNKDGGGLCVCVCVVVVEGISFLEV